MAEPDDSHPLTRDIAPFGVRMPPDLKERVQAAAKQNNRSVNAEIVATLEKAYPIGGGLKSLVDMINAQKNPNERRQIIELAEKALEELKKKAG